MRCPQCGSKECCGANMHAEIDRLRAELEGAKSDAAKCAAAHINAVAACNENARLLTEARRVIESARMAEGLLRSSLGSTKVLLASCETALEERDAQLTAARRVIDESQRQVPVAWLIHDGRNAPWFCESDILAERCGPYAKPLYATPVPAQPAYDYDPLASKDHGEAQASVPEAVAKELPEELFDAHAVYMESGVEASAVVDVLDTVVRMIRAREKAAILSAADDEVGNGQHE